MYIGLPKETACHQKLLALLEMKPFLFTLNLLAAWVNIMTLVPEPFPDLTTPSVITNMLYYNPGASHNEVGTKHCTVFDKFSTRSTKYRQVQFSAHGKKVLQ